MFMLLEASMSMDSVKRSVLNEYKGNIPYSKSQKGIRAIYKNVYNTINDDNLISNIAPKQWDFARPRAEHKLLEGRKSGDIATMENILKEFLVNKVSKAEWDKKVKSMQVKNLKIINISVRFIIILSLVIELYNF